MSTLPAHPPGSDPQREQRLNEVIAAYLEAIEAGTARPRPAAQE